MAKAVAEKMGLAILVTPEHHSAFPRLHRMALRVHLKLERPEGQALKGPLMADFKTRVVFIYLFSNCTG